MRLSLIASAATLALVCGCGDSTPDPNDPSQAQANQYGQYTPPAGQQGGYQQPTGGYTQPTATTTAPPAATGMPGMPGGGVATGAAAQPIAVAVAAPAIQPVLQQVAASEVQGMQAEGAPFGANFQEGQILEQQFTIQPGKCYSVVGASMGVQELDIQLVLNAAPLPPQLLAQDNSQGGTAVLGGKTNGCFKNALPMAGPGKVIVKATRGAGMAVVQIYVK